MCLKRLSTVTRGTRVIIFNERVTCYAWEAEAQILELLRPGGSLPWKQFSLSTARISAVEVCMLRLSVS